MHRWAYAEAVPTLMRCERASQTFSNLRNLLCVELAYDCRNQNAL